MWETGPLSVPPSPAAGAPPYVGPGDIVPGATFWFGLRAYNTAYATGSNPALDLHNDSTGAFVATINILSTGALDVATAATVIAGGAAKIGKLYDQSGTGNHATQGTLARMPSLVLSGHGALPVMRFSRAGDPDFHCLTTPSISTSPQPYTISAVAKRTGAFTNYSSILVANTGLYFNNTADTALAYGGSLGGTTAAPDNVMHGIQGVFNGTSGILNIDGVANTVDTGTADIGTGVWQIGANGSTANGLTGDIGEGGLWKSVAFSAGNNTAVFNNQDARWII